MTLLQIKVTASSLRTKDDNEYHQTRDTEPVDEAITVKPWPGGAYPYTDKRSFDCYTEQARPEHRPCRIDKSDAFGDKWKEEWHWSTINGVKHQMAEDEDDDNR